MKYYRTYITTFETSTGLKVYAGKRGSKYENPKDDPYTGSGKLIRNAVKKYGPDCIQSIQWFDHIDETEMNTAETELILECKAKYGSKCVNLAKGGEGGYTLEYATDERKAEASAKRGAALKEAFARPEVKAKKSVSAKESWADPEVKAKRSATQKEAMRSSPVWHGDLYITLWETWLDLGKPRYGTFQTHCRRNGITDLSLLGLVNHFNERYTQEKQNI